MKLNKINIPRDKLLKYKGNLKLTNIKNIEISDAGARKLADILGNSEGISLMHKERQASTPTLDSQRGTSNA